MPGKVFVGSMGPGKFIKIGSVLLAKVAKVEAPEKIKFVEEDDEIQEVSKDGKVNNSKREMEVRHVELTMVIPFRQSLSVCMVGKTAAHQLHLPLSALVQTRSADQMNSVDLTFTVSRVHLFTSPIS